MTLTAKQTLMTQTMTKTTVKWPFCHTSCMLNETTMCNSRLHVVRYTVARCERVRLCAHEKKSSDLRAGV